MIEETLLQYGAIAAVCIYFMYKDYRLISVIENNTKALTRFYEVLKIDRK
jgi:undecaprenyl pyrophosphate phosphatase UppP